MNVQLPLRIDKSAFLEWIQGREGRYELAESRVVIMTGASLNHAIIVGNLQSLLWVRGEAGFPLSPEVIERDDEAVRIPDLGIVLQFSEVYADLEET